MEKITDEQLWNLIDGFLSNDEKRKIEQEIEKNNELNARFSKIKAEKTLFSSVEIEKPNSDFASKLLENWAAEQLVTASAPTNYRLLKMVFGAFGLLSIVLALIIYHHQGASGKIDFQFPEITIPWKSITLLLTTLSAILMVTFIEKLISTRNNLNFLAIK